MPYNTMPDFIAAAEAQATSVLLSQNLSAVVDPEELLLLNGLLKSLSPKGAPIADLGFAQLFTTSGTWTAPDDTTPDMIYKFTVVGGGGGRIQGSAYNSNYTYGGGGGCAVKFVTGVYPGMTLVMTIGNAGSTSTSSGSAGQASGLASGTIILPQSVSAGGGLYNSRAASQTQDANTYVNCGTATGGDINRPQIPSQSNYIGLDRASQIAQGRNGQGSAYGVNTLQPQGGSIVVERFRGY
jgi:hypothetical protein